MTGSIIAPPMTEPPAPGAIQLGLVNRLLDTLDQSLLVAERSGRILLGNSRARKCMESIGLGEFSKLNLFSDILQVDAKEIFSEIESGEQEVKLNLARGDKKASASVQWVPEPDWLIGELGPQTE